MESNTNNQFDDIYTFEKSIIANFQPTTKRHEVIMSSCRLINQKCDCPCATMMDCQIIKEVAKDDIR
jgi:hypothetical protein